jgi:hypothetical protein
MVTTRTTKFDMAQGTARAPAGHRPWEDQTVSPEERYQSYYAVVRAKA